VSDRASQLSTEDADATIETDLPDDCVVQAHPALTLAIEEALRNAVGHNPGGVEVTVRLWRDGGGDVRVDIADTGRGIPENERRTLRNAEETPLEHTEGLGLWMIYWTVTRSGGTVEFEDNDPQGTRVRIRLPGRRGSGAPTEATSPGDADEIR
jgi:signal transduction histidine kinase